MKTVNWLKLSATDDDCQLLDLNYVQRALISFWAGFRWINNIALVFLLLLETIVT